MGNSVIIIIFFESSYQNTAEREPRDTLARGEKEHDRRSVISCELQLGSSLLLGTWHRANAPRVWEDESFNYRSC